MCDQMLANEVTELKGPTGLRQVMRPVPQDPERVIIRNKASGVCFPDLLQTYGKYQDRPSLPFTPGMEVAGIVHAAGGASDFAQGDRVMAACFSGGYAEYVAADPRFVFRLPDELDYAQGAAMVVNYQTAYFALVRRARLEAHESVLVRGAAGGLGTAIVQVAKAVGAHVTAVVSSSEKMSAAHRAGADEVVIAGEANWLQIVQEPHHRHRFHLVVDPVGGETLDDCMRALMPAGRVLVLGFASGTIPSVAANRLLLRNIEAIGAAWGPYVTAEPGVAGELAAALEQLVKTKGLRPIIGARYRLAEARDALIAMESRSSTGKLVLES